MSGHRVFVGRLFQEGNSFSPLPTDSSNFVIASGSDMLTDARRSASSLGGGMRVLKAAGAELCPGLSAIAPPGGLVREATYEALRDELIDGATVAHADGVFLDLHGAMATESCDDAEGDLLGRLRSRIGPEIPIAIALDLHAHVTPAMLEAVDICIACKENPHTDYADAGAHAADLLLQRLEGRISPVTALVTLPLVIGARLGTGEGPLAALHTLRREAAKSPGVLDISIYNTIPFLDARGAGQSVTVTTNGHNAQAAAAAADLARALWDCRDEFTPDLPSLAEVLAKVAEARPAARPFVLGDQGDRVLAGAPGDATAILSEILTNWPDLKAVIPVTDPGAVAAATAAGVGHRLTYALGGRLSEMADPLEADWRVVQLGDGRFVQRGPYLAGEPADLGATAVLEHDNVTVLATSKPGFTQDPEAFASNGIDLDGYDVVVSKSGFHFRISFEGLGTCVVVDTPGLSNYAPGLFHYRLRRPCAPEDPIDSPSFEARLFRSAGRASA